MGGRAVPELSELLRGRFSIPFSLINDPWPATRSSREPFTPRGPNGRAPLSRGETFASEDRENGFYIAEAPTEIYRPRDTAGIISNGLAR